MVRAKFTLSSVRAELIVRKKDPNGAAFDPNNLEAVEVRTLEFVPVFEYADLEQDNKQVWASTPLGGLELGMIEPRAWSQFELGQEYYIDFTRVNRESQQRGKKEDA